MSDPTFITALATLIASITALIKVLQVQRAQANTHETIKAIDVHTNGTLTALQQNVIDLRSTIATPAELEARSNALPGVPGQP